MAPLKLLIIDEFSCLGLAFLHTVSSRLSLLKGDPRPFGGISVLLNGDLFQLPPPGDAPSYKEISSTAQSAQALGKALYISLFTTVIVFEPEVTQRQRADPRSPLCSTVCG